MQTSQLVVAALAVVLFTATSGVSAQGQITGTRCVFNYTDFLNNTWNYDLSGLRLPAGQDYGGFDTNVAYQYYLNVCNSVNCVNPVAGVCQMRLVNNQWTAYHNLGFYDGSAQATWDIIDPRQPGNGIKFVLANGDSCPGSGPRTSTIFFDCNPTAPDPSTVNITCNSKGCQYEFHIPSPSSCGVQPQPTPTPNPTPIDNGGSSGLSGGSVFLIIFFVFGFVYVAGGCIFRRVSYGVSGMEACPNHEFWSSLPGLVSDGFAYFWNTLTCRGAGGQTSTLQYENVK